MNGSVALNQAKKYTDKSLQGLGSIKGSPCTIKSVTEINNGTEIIFEWKSQQGISETSTIFVENGVSITDININVDNHLICTLADSTIIDAGELKATSIWSEINGKPFKEIGKGLYVDNGVLKASTAKQTDWEQTDTEAEDYINNKPEFDELTKADIDALLGFDEKELEYLAKVINDSTVQLDKTYSSSKIYTELQNVLDMSKAYTLAEISKVSGASYKVVTSTSDMTDVRFIYLLANGDTYDMYIYEEDTNTATKIGDTSIELSNVYTKNEVDNAFVLKTAFLLLENGMGNVANLITTAKTVVDAINEIKGDIDEHISDSDIHVTPDDKANLHKHTNKDLLDNITQDDIDKWNNMSAVDAKNTAYENTNYPQYTDVELALNALFNKVYYVKPTCALSADKKGGTFEMGTVISAPITFTWSTNKDITSQTLTGCTLADASVRSAIYDTNVSSDKTFTLTVSDGENSASSSVSYKFLNKVYYGSASEPDVYDSAFILGLANSKFATTIKGSYPITVESGQFGYIACPKSFNAPSECYIGGFLTTLENAGEISFTNASGGVATYTILRTGKSGLGSLTMEFK